MSERVEHMEHAERVEHMERVERVQYVTADDGCELWTIRSADGLGGTVGAVDQDDAVSAGSGVSGKPGQTAAGSRHGYVLCHGGPGFWDTLGPIARMLEDGGRGPVVRWDQRGGGRSKWQGPYTVDRFLADLDQVREHHGFDEVTLLGHSWGATLVLAYALRFPARVRRLIYVAGVGLGWDWRPEHSARAKAARAQLPTAPRLEELAGLAERTRDEDRELELLRMSVEFPDRAAAAERAATLLVEFFDSDDGVKDVMNVEVRSWLETELAARCRALEVPTLIIDGEQDLRPRWAVDSLEDALPNCTRVRLARSGHFPWIDEPAEFAAALLYVV